MAVIVSRPPMTRTEIDLPRIRRLPLLDGASAETLSTDDPLWGLVSDYLAQMIVALTYTIAPRRIVLGGGVGQTPHVLSRTRERVASWLGGYLPDLRRPGVLEDYLVAPALGENSGVLGAIVLAENASA